MLCASLILGAHLATLHFDYSVPRNGLNVGAYASCDDVVAGVYYNSQWRWSPYTGYVWHAGPVDIITGVVGGYQGVPVAPLVLPSMLVADHVRLSVIPPLKYSGKGGAHLSAEWSF